MIGPGGGKGPLGEAVAGSGSGAPLGSESTELPGMVAVMDFEECVPGPGVEGAKERVIDRDPNIRLRWKREMERRETGRFINDETAEVTQG